jgi:hypothetical protein
MALSSRPDTRFFRNTGLALVSATVFAGIIMLSLAFTGRDSNTLAHYSEKQVAMEPEFAQQSDTGVRGFKFLSVAVHAAGARDP